MDYFCWMLKKEAIHFPFFGDDNVHDLSRLCWIHLLIAAGVKEKINLICLLPNDYFHRVKANLQQLARVKRNVPREYLTT